MRVIFILLFLTGCSLGTQLQTEDKPELKRIQRGDLISYCGQRGRTMDCSYVSRDRVAESLKSIYGLHY